MSMLYFVEENCIGGIRCTFISNHWPPSSAFFKKKKKKKNDFLKFPFALQQKILR